MLTEQEKSNYLSASRIRRLEQKDQFDSLYSPLEPQICFLGTNSSRPVVVRGASAILVSYRDSSMLMDCAEGTIGQLWDHLGEADKVKEALAKTRVIYITHKHADHHLGLSKWLWERDLLDCESSVYVVIPPQLNEWAAFFMKSAKLRKPDLIKFVSTCDLNPESHHYY